MATTEAWRLRKPPNELPAVERPGASVSSLRLSEQGYVGSGPREERDLSAPTLGLGLAILSRAAFDARALGAPGNGDRSGSTDCFTASAILWTPEPSEFAGLFASTRAKARRFRVCDTQNVIRREARALRVRNRFATLTAGPRDATLRWL